MTTTSPETLKLLGRAAKLRAEGNSWTDAAKQLAISHDELRRLVSEHTSDYDRLARRARNEVHRESMDEALSTLRRLMRSEEPDIGMVAATTFVRYTLARMRLGTDAAGEQLVRQTRKITVQAENVRGENSSELAKVPNPQDVDAAKKVAQTAPPSAARPAAQPAPATPTPPALAKPATAPAGKEKAGVVDEIRREKFIQAAVFGHLGPRTPVTKSTRETLEVERLMQSCLGDAK